MMHKVCDNIALIHGGVQKYYHAYAMTLKVRI